jgi:hypothetical protein
MKCICKALVKYVNTLYKLWESSEVIANHSSFQVDEANFAPCLCKVPANSFRVRLKPLYAGQRNQKVPEEGRAT